MRFFKKKPKTPEQERKVRSELWLRANQVQICDWLPPACEDNCEIRGRDEIVNRILAIHCVFARSYVCLQEDGDPSKIQRVYELTGGLEHLSPAEKKFIDDTNPAEQLMVQFHWQIECMYTLWWSLNAQESLLAPNELCDLGQTTSGCLPEKLVSGHGMQDASVIRDAFDLYYRLHWAVVEQSLVGETEADSFVGGAVVERRRALTWLCDSHCDWDEVDMST